MALNPGDAIFLAKVISKVEVRESATDGALTCRAWELSETRMALDILAVGRAVSCDALQSRHPSRMRPRRAPPSRFLADQEKIGAYGTGSWTDTSPPNGCRTATEVAVWELAENPVACGEPL